MDPHCQSGPNEGPKVLRVYNAVKGQNQRKCAFSSSLFEDCTLICQWKLANVGCDALVHRVAKARFKKARIFILNGNVSGPGLFQKGMNGLNLAAF